MGRRSFKFAGNCTELDVNDQTSLEPMIYGQIALPTYHFVLNLSQRSVASPKERLRRANEVARRRSGPTRPGQGPLWASQVEADR